MKNLFSIEKILNEINKEINLKNNSINSLKYSKIRNLNNQKKYLFKDDDEIVEAYSQIFNNHLLELCIISKNVNNEKIRKLLTIENRIGYLKNRENYLNTKTKNTKILFQEDIKDILNIFSFKLDTYNLIALRDFIVKEINNHIFIIIQFDITCEMIINKDFNLFHTSICKNLNKLIPNTSTIQIYTEPRIYCGINIAITPNAITNIDIIKKYNYRIYKLLNADKVPLYKDPEFFTKFNGERKITEKNYPLVEKLPSVYIVSKKEIGVIDVTDEYLNNYIVDDNYKVEIKEFV